MRPTAPAGDTAQRSKRLSTSISASTRSGGSCSVGIALRLAVNMIENLDPRFVRGHEPREPRLHGLVPDLGIELVCEAIGICR